MPRNGSHAIIISNTPSEPGFDEALAAGLAYEIQDDTVDGNFHHDPNGNPTKWGIDQTQHPYIDVPSITRPGAVYFYLENPTMWPRAKEVPGAFGELRSVYFEGLINTGSRATKALQRAFGMTGEDVDGVWGPITRKAMNDALKYEGEESIIRKYFHGRKFEYEELVRRYPERNAKNLQGWKNRVDDTSDWYDSVVKARRAQA
jgi:hypothetical protein